MYLAPTPLFMWHMITTLLILLFIIHMFKKSLAHTKVWLILHTCLMVRSIFVSSTTPSRYVLMSPAHGHLICKLFSTV